MPTADYSVLRDEVTTGKTAPVTDTGSATSDSGLNSKKPEFKAAVGLSRQWDARKAGREVAYKTLEKLGTKPDFFLLFSTIHYEKYGGFKEFLAGVWEILPKGTPLIGGTVAGFINNHGCFTRGATAMAVSYPNMDVVVGVGKNTKRAPHIAANECARMIKEGLENSKYENKFLFEVVSGGKIPQFPGLGRRKVIKSGIIGKLATTLSHISLIVLQKGVGREEEILESLVSQLPDYTIIGGSAIDCNNMVENFQFFGRYVYSNSLVALGLKTNLDIKVNTTYGLKDTNIKMNITKKSGNDRVIHRIDNAPALDSFLKKITWPDDFIDERLYRKTFFIPLGYEKEGILFPNVIGLFLGKDMVCGYKIEDNELHLLSASGRSLIGAVDENLEEFKRDNNLFSIVVSCAARLETLGMNIFHVREKLINFFKDSPFLLIFMGGEDTYSSKKGRRHINESFNVAVLSQHSITKTQPLSFNSKSLDSKAS